MREIAEDYSNIGSALPDTLKELSKILMYHEVMPQEYKIKNMPLVSFCYAHCRAIILQNGAKSALSHLLPDDDPSFFIDNMVKDMRADPRKLEAMVITGDDPAIIENYLGGKGVRITDSYYGKKDEKGTFYSRDIIVIPAKGEVLIYTQKEKIIKRFSVPTHFQIFKGFLLKTKNTAVRNYKKNY